MQELKTSPRKPTIKSLPPEFRAAVSAASSRGGEIARPVACDGLWHLIQVAARRQPELTEESRDEIRDIDLGEWLEEERRRRRIDDPLAV